jgi:hypothetical protein
MLSAQTTEYETRGAAARQRMRAHSSLKINHSPLKINHSPLKKGLQFTPQPSSKYSLTYYFTN